MRLAEGLVVPGEEPLHRLLGELLAVKDNVGGQRRVGRELELGGPRSSAALISHSRASAARASGRIEERSFSHDRAWQRGAQAGTALETLARPDEDVRRCAGAPEPLVGELAPLAVFRSLAGDDDHQVEIAILPVVPAGLRAEEVDPLRLVSLDETLQDAYESARLLLRQVGKRATNALFKLSAVTHCAPPGPARGWSGPPLRSAIPSPP